MNRTTHTLLFKSMLAFAFLTIQFHAFSQKVFYSQVPSNLIGTPLIFSTPTYWNTNPGGTGNPPDPIDFKSTNSQFVIQSSHKFYVGIDKMVLGALTLESGTTLDISGFTLTINGDLTINKTGSATSTIDFGTITSILIVNGNLNGGSGSTIQHNAASPTVTQSLILYGEKNSLHTFNNITPSNGGRSVVSYVGQKDQTVFPSDKYAVLLIGGSGTKTLTAEPFNVNAGTVTTVSRKLQLGEKLKLGALDLVYTGINDSLFYKNGIDLNGWIWTDDKGMLKIYNTSARQTFPVGDGVTVKALDFSISNTPPNNLELGVRYNVSEPNVVITPNGVGPWYINSNKEFNATIKLINPIPANQKLSVPTLARSLTGQLWSPISPNIFEISFRIYTPNNYLTILDCAPPAITPATLPVGFKDVPYSFGNIQLDKDRAGYIIDGASLFPPDDKKDIGMTQGGTVHIEFTPNTITNYAFSFTVRDKYSCQTTFDYTIPVITPPSPNLYITPIDAKTYGDADFKLSTYTKNTAVPVVYSISPNTCAELVSGNMVHIKCAGPVPNNSITVTATQAASGLYKGESVSTTFFINKAQSKLSIKNTGFLPNTTGALIYEKTSDSLPKFTQLTRPDLATVSQNGQLTTFGSTGTFSVSANIVATDNYTAFDSIYTFTIYTTKQAPVAANDTISIQMGQDTTLNLLVNDYGVTDPINSTLTDIDLENAGIQKKYYSTSLGTFNIDPAGILAIHPFEGFIGTDKIAYTITDEAGLVSNVAYLVITVEPPVKIPALKANEVMTPNNDGLNDALVIANTNLESENSLIITDETGNIVFEQDNYRNDWKGTNKKGNNLESGVYFYVFTEKHSGRMLQNYLQIAGY